MIPLGLFGSLGSDVKFDDSTYIHFDDYLDEELNDIVLSMVKECKYSERKFGTL